MTGNATPAESIGVAISGAGRIGRLHARLIAREVPGLHVAGITDVNEVAARQLADELGVPVFDDSTQAVLLSQAVHESWPTDRLDAALQAYDKRRMTR